MTKPCHTPDCDNYVGDQSTIGLCKSCYASIHYWHKKTPKALIQRAQKLILFGSRMDLMLPSNTSIMHSKSSSQKIAPLAIMPGEFRKPKKGKVKNGVISMTPPKRTKKSHAG